MPCAGTLVAALAREVRPGESADGGRQRLLVVLVHELHPMTMRETVIGGIEVAALVALGLIARIEQHRVHAVLVGKGEVEDLELDRHACVAALSALDLDRRRGRVREGASRSM